MGGSHILLEKYVHIASLFNCSKLLSFYGSRIEVSWLRDREGVAAGAGLVCSFVGDFLPRHHFLVAADDGYIQ